MSSPPQTPTHRPTSSHRRHPSSLDMSYSTPSRRQSMNRRSSGFSQITPRSSREFEHGSPAQHFDGGGDSNGLGNLADELDQVWDDDEDLDGDYGEEMELPQDDLAAIGTAVEHDGSYGVDSAVNGNGVRDSGVAMPSSSPARLSPGSAIKSRKHVRQRSMYDGSDYGDDSDIESESVSLGLERRMADVESLARRGMEENGSASDQVVKRTIEQLRDLGSQIAIENGATRLKTTHDALTTHLTHQSRTLTSLASSFSGPRPIIPDLDALEDLLPLIESTLELLPHSSTDPLMAISHLTRSTTELLQHLGNVSDTLHMSRQTTTNATRKLKVSKEQLQDWKRENEKTQEGQEYIEQGNWNQRLQDREAKRVCDDVLNGFESECGKWRERLCERLGVASGDWPDQEQSPQPMQQGTGTAADSLQQAASLQSGPASTSPHIDPKPHYYSRGKSTSSDSTFPDWDDD